MDDVHQVLIRTVYENGDLFVMTDDDDDVPC